MEKKFEILEKIRSSQQPDGSFLIFKNEKEAGLESPYATALVLSLLCEIDSGDCLELIKNKAFYYLLGEGDNWKFSPVGKKHKSDFPVEEELGTTFLALSSLVKYDREILDGKTIVGILKILTDCEADEGGPYYSGTDGSGARSVGLSANIQICNFLALCKVDLEKLDRYLEEKIEPVLSQPQLTAADLLNIYFFSKNAKDGMRERFSAYLNEFLKNTGIDKLLRLLAIGSLSNLGEPVDGFEGELGLDEVVPKIKPDRFTLLPLAGGLGIKDGLLFDYNLLSTLFQIVVWKKKFGPIALEKDPKEEIDAEVYGRVIKDVRHSFKRTGAVLEESCNRTLDRIIGFDRGYEIGLLSYKFKEALGECGGGIPEAMARSLGVANFYLWMAYTVYDDFFDGEGDPKSLPVANFCQREFVAIYAGLIPENKEFKIIFNQVMDSLDSANAWELAEARTKVDGNIFHIPEKIPDYKNFSTLSERSLAHGLGPMAILVKLGYSVDSPEIANLFDFFRCYLVSRQLNDDSHDWEDDFKKGRVTSIVAAILLKLGNRSASPSLLGSKIDLLNDFPVLQKYFWMEMLPGICQEVLGFVEKSKQSLRKIPVVKSPELMEKYLQSAENAALQAKKEHKQALNFLESYP